MTSLDIWRPSCCLFAQTSCDLRLRPGVSRVLVGISPRHFQATFRHMVFAVVVVGMDCFDGAPLCLSQVLGCMPCLVFAAEGVWFCKFWFGLGVGVLALAVVMSISDFEDL